MAKAGFQEKDRVRLRARPQDKGRVLDIRQYSRGFEYLVAFSGSDEQWYPEGDLELIPDRQYRWLKSDAFLRDVLIAKLRHPLADSLYAYRASRTEFEPYQFRPALKFLRQPEQRILIADEVGLGKTIEAAIIYLELKARTDVSRVLVMCPARLKKKWIDELLNRFDEKFTDLDQVGLQAIFDQYDRSGTVAFRGIASYETLRRESIKEEFEKRPAFGVDLLIADEAHYMRNSETATYKLGATLTDMADAVVFLTATPLQLGSDNLFHLMHLLLPGEYDSSAYFSEQIRPNQYINRAVTSLTTHNYQDALTELRKVEGTYVADRFLKNPYYIDILQRLRQRDLDRSENIKLQRDLLELNTLSSVFTRTRKREVVNAAVRAAYSINVKLTPDEMAFYEGIMRQTRLQSARIQNFGLVQQERMAASCLVATRQSFENRAAQRLQKGNIETTFVDIDDDTDLRLSESSQELLRLSRNIGQQDSKFDLFKQTLDKALAEGTDSKALVFSYFRLTLDYLHKRLQDAGYKVGIIHGGIPLQERQAVIDQFRKDAKIKILLSSEVGAEGLDFQFCDVLMNYDLPWNPMQVEQRIGRLDRFGQKHKRIRIYNFFIANTIEERILERLYTRINIFKQSIGDLEDILGEEINQLSRKVFQRELTPNEEIQLAEESANRILKRQQAVEDLEKSKDELLGQEAIFSQQINDAVNTGRVIGGEEVRALVETFLKEEFDNIEFTRDEDEPVYTLTITPKLAASLNQFARSNSTRYYSRGTRFDEAMVQHKQIALTFDNDFARERNLLEFITHQHLLAAAAFAYWTKKLVDGHIPAARVIVESESSHEVGDGQFFIYALDEKGLVDRRTLYPVIVLDNGQVVTETAKTLLSRLQFPCSYTKQLTEAPEEDQRRCETLANGWMAEQRDRVSHHSNKLHKALVDVREASIRQSFGAKIRRAEELMSQVQEIRIRNLRKGQINNLKAQRDEKIRVLREKNSVSVSYLLIAAGRIRLLPYVEKAPVSQEPEPVIVIPEVKVEPVIRKAKKKVAHKIQRVVADKMPAHETVIELPATNPRYEPSVPELQVEPELLIEKPLVAQPIRETKPDPEMPVAEPVVVEVKKKVVTKIQRVVADKMPAHETVIELPATNPRYGPSVPELQVEPEPELLIEKPLVAQPIRETKPEPEMAIKVETKIEAIADAPKPSNILQNIGKLISNIFGRK